MPRTRLVSPDFFLHEALAGCSAHARLLFVALWTQADREGRLRWVPLQIHGATFPYEPGLDIEELGGELCSADCLKLYSVGGRAFALLPGFTRWQKPHRNESASRCPDPEAGNGSVQWIERLGPKVSPIRISRSKNTATTVKTQTSSSSSPPQQFVQDDVGGRPPPGPTVPTGDDLLDYVLTEWPGKLGQRATLQAWVSASRAAHPAVDLLAEARKARAWELGMPGRTKKAVRSFLTRWWGRAQDSGRSSAGGRAARPTESDEERLARLFGEGAKQP